MAQTKRALISVSDKSGVTELARGLAELGIEIVSTGGTAALLRKAGIEVREVADLTGFPEIMDGRIKTLHPGVHGGLLPGESEAVLTFAYPGGSPNEIAWMQETVTGVVNDRCADEGHRQPSVADMPPAALELLGLT